MLAITGSDGDGDANGDDGGGGDLLVTAPADVKQIKALGGQGKPSEVQRRHSSNEAPQARAET